MIATTLLTAIMLAKVGPVDFPSVSVKKTLYATNDLRGKQFGTLEFGTPLTEGMPKASDLKGKVILIDFWATWCPPCRAVIPEMNEWKKKFGKDLVIYGVSDEAQDVVKTFMTKSPMEYNVTVDPAKVMSKRLGVQGIPHVVVLSQDGIVRYQGFPLQEEDKLTTEKLAQIIEANKALKAN